MGEALRHRGPDDRGVWIDEAQGLALAHRRLSINDLTPDGRQPMVSSCGRWVLAFNGEVYNFQSLREHLSRAGQVFRGHSDTEVLLASIAKWGVTEALRVCEGMLAFALWDREERALFLARDRVGKKPLYIARAGTTLLFGSELRALKRHPQFHREIDRRALSVYLRHNCIPAPFTIFRDARKLCPGTVLRVTPAAIANGTELSDLVTDAEVYWSARAATEQALRSPFEGSEEEAVVELDRVLKGAVEKRMISDVPLGAFLSGGIDSSTTVALMQAQSSRPVRTFTIGIEDVSGDEAVHAKKIAAHLGTDHSELYVTPSEARSVIPRLPTMYSEPFADSSQIPTFLVSEMARRDVTVALSGDGGDELFGGYNRHFWSERLWRSYGWMPPSVRRGVSRLITAVPPRGWDRTFDYLNRFLPPSRRQSGAGYKLHKIGGVIACDGIDEMYRGFVTHWEDPASVVIDGSEPATLLDRQSAFPRPSSPAERMMHLDFATYLPDDILVKVDRASMAVGLEARNPFLDTQVIEFAWRLPLVMKIQGGRGKHLVRRLLHRYVPKHLVDRPKSGFGIPLKLWLRGPLRGWAEELLDERRLVEEGFFRPEPIREKWSELLAGTREWQYHIWDVLMFQAWLEQE